MFELPARASVSLPRGLGLAVGPHRVILLPWPREEQGDHDRPGSEHDRLLSRAARERGVSRAEFIRQHLALVLEHYRPHPKPRSAGILRGLTERGDEGELFRAGRYRSGVDLRHPRIH